MAALFAAAALGQVPAWTPGTLDIHQIQTGRGNAAFVVFPDGTTLLIDAGTVPDRPGPQLAPRVPNATRTPAEWIADYIEQFGPRHPATLDYALVTHYHDDHMGGIPALAAIVPIRTLIDRGDRPVPPPGSVTDAYRQFLRTFKGTRQTLHAGRADQIVPNRTVLNFEVRNVAVNGEVWTGGATQTQQVAPAPEQLTENELSAALRIQYGRFRYYSGGDLAGVPLDNLPAWHDLETPVAKAVGPVDAAVLDHHGWLDSTNIFFLQTLRPRVIVIPAWHATHPDHGVLRRIISKGVWPDPRDIFTTTLLDAPRDIFSYLPDPFQSRHGHILIRVTDSGARYRVFILDDTDQYRKVLSVHGPYESK